MNSSAPRFSLGQLMITPAALSTANAADIDLFALLARHQSGDWGEVSKEDANENERSIQYEFRIWSVYRINPDQPNERDNRFWIITEADRSYTTILLPSDY